MNQDRPSPSDAGSPAAGPRPAGRLADRLAFGDFVLERSQQRVLRSDGSNLDLTPRLFNALSLFVEHAGELLDKDTLMRRLWPGLVVEENNVNQVVASLRRALGDDAQHPRLIETVPRFGFRFIAPVDVAEGAPTGSSTAVTTAAAPRGPPVPATVPAVAASARRRWMALAGAAALAGGGLWAWRRAGPGSAASTASATLAVLPFKPLSDEARDPLLEIGMADSIGARLSTVPGLAVSSTASVQGYAGVAQDPVRAARELGVQWIVDGSLQRRGDALRATARLLRADSGVAAWSGSFDTQFGGVFDVQDQIAARVQAALLPALAAGLRPSQAIAEPGGTRNPEAYQLYLAAIWRGQGGGSDSIQRAIALLQQALAIDPGFAMAWTELAWVQRRRLWNTDGEPSDVFSNASAALAKALALVPDLPHALAGRGFGYNWYEFDWAAAEREYRNALARNPNVVAAHWGLTGLLLTQGRLDEGWLHLRRTRELDPMSPLFSTMAAAYLTDHGALDEAQRRLDIAFDLAPQLWLAHVAQGQLWVAQGRPDEGIDALRRAVKFGRSSSRARAVLAAHLAWLGRPDEARAMLVDLQRDAGSRYVPPTSLAMVQAALGQRDAALDGLEQAWRSRDARLVFLKNDPSWRGLRNEPRYQALLKKLRLDGLPPGLTPV